jgi:hypothetical protein
LEFLAGLASAVISLALRSLNALGLLLPQAVVLVHEFL